MNGDDKIWTMDDPAIRALAQRDPLPNIAAAWGEAAAETNRLVGRLIDALRNLDRIQAQLSERQLTATVDLGPIGNAAAAARRDLEKRSDRPTFEMPR